MKLLAYLLHEEDVNASDISAHTSKNKKDASTEKKFSAKLLLKTIEYHVRDIML